MRINLKKVHENLTSKWAEKAKEYFDRHMKKDLQSYSGRWVIEKFPALYDLYSGITNKRSFETHGGSVRISSLLHDAWPVSLSVITLWNAKEDEQELGTTN